MMRAPSHTDFSVDVPGIGHFVFARRTYGDRIRIRAEYLRLVGGTDDVDDNLSTLAAMLAAYRILVVDAPAKYRDFAAIDCIEHDQEQIESDLLAVYRALCNKEDSFRPGANATGEGASAGGARNA